MLKYAGTFAINHEKIRKHPERISKIKPYLDQYHWKDITKDWKNFKQTTTFVLNIMFNQEMVD